MRAVVKAVRGVGQGLDKLGQKFEAAPFVEGCTWLLLVFSDAVLHVRFCA